MSHTQKKPQIPNQKRTRHLAFLFERPNYRDKVFCGFGFLKFFLRQRSQISHSRIRVSDIYICYVCYSQKAESLGNAGISLMMVIV